MNQSDDALCYVSPGRRAGFNQIDSLQRKLRPGFLAKT